MILSKIKKIDEFGVDETMLKVGLEIIRLDCNIIKKPQGNSALS